MSTTTVTELKMGQSQYEHFRYKIKRERQNIFPPWLQLQLPSQEMGPSYSERLIFKIKRERERIHPPSL